MFSATYRRGRHLSSLIGLNPAYLRVFLPEAIISPLTETLQEFYRPIGRRSLQIKDECCEILEGFNGRNTLRGKRFMRLEEGFALLVLGPDSPLLLEGVEINKGIAGIEAESRADVIQGARSPFQH